MICDSDYLRSQDPYKLTKKTWVTFESFKFLIPLPRLKFKPTFVLKDSPTNFIIFKGQDVPVLDRLTNDVNTVYDDPSYNDDSGSDADLVRNVDKLKPIYVLLHKSRSS